MPKRKIESLEIPPRLYYYDADGNRRSYNVVMFMDDLSKKVNEIIEKVNEIEERLCEGGL